MKNYYNEERSFLHNFVKLEYFENLEKIRYCSFRHFLSGFKNSMDFLT